MSKIFNLAVCSGRFQHLHIGHEFIINTALSMANKVVLFISHPNAEYSEQNPFSLAERKEIIELVYNEEVESGRLTVTTIEEYNEDIIGWANFAFNLAEKVANEKVDLIVYGADKSDLKWYNEDDLHEVTRIIVSEKIKKSDKYISIRGTLLRQYLLLNDKEKWMGLVNPKLYESYDTLRAIILDKQ